MSNELTTEEIVALVRGIDWKFARQNDMALHQLGNAIRAANLPDDPEPTQVERNQRARTIMDNLARATLPAPASSAPAVATGGATPGAGQPIPGAGSGVATGGATGGAVGAWKVGSLLSVNTYDYPGMGSLFAQVWQGDDLIARVYGDTADEVRSRADRITAPTAEEAAGGAFNHAELDALVEKGTKAWTGTPADWLEELRGGPTLEQRHAHGVAMLMASAPATGGAKQAATVPWEPKFEAISHAQEQLSVHFCTEIAGKRGSKPSLPDPVRLLEMAEALYQCERDDPVIGRAAATTDGEGES